MSQLIIQQTTCPLLENDGLNLTQSWQDRTLDMLQGIELMTLYCPERFQLNIKG